MVSGSNILSVFPCRAFAVASEVSALQVGKLSHIHSEKLHPSLRFIGCITLSFAYLPETRGPDSLPVLLCRKQLSKLLSGSCAC
jgi:hypothetical protein